MNVQRFTGRTNKLALEQVRAAMGSEALILSNKRTAEVLRFAPCSRRGRLFQRSSKRAPRVTVW